MNTKRLAMLLGPIILIVGLLLHPSAQAQTLVDSWQTQYTTTFADLAEYDIGNWRGNASSNGELEYYRPSQVRALPGGGVQLIATKNSNGRYLSGLIQTDGYVTVKPGSFVTASIKLPLGQGFWPAFWLWNYGANSRTEFDIMEAVSPDFTWFESSIHANNDPQDRDADNHTGVDLSAAFHTYSMWWEPTFIAFYFDGVEFARETTNIPTEDMFVVFNFAVGGFWPGAPDASTPFPSSMTIANFSVLTHATGVIPLAPPGGTIVTPSPTPAPRRHHR